MRKYIIIGVIILVVGAVVASVVVVGKTLLSNAATPAPTNTQPVIRIPPPTPDNIASPTAITNTAPTSQMSTADLINQAANGTTTNSSTTSTGWTVVGSGDVTVTPQLSIDGKSLNLNFSSTNFSKITDISYSLSYIADPQVTKFVKGSFSPAGQPSPILKVVPLGTCSGTNCVYDANPRGFTLKVLVKTNNGLSVYLITLTSS